MRKEGFNEKRSSVGGQRLACPLPWPILAKENVSYGSPSLKRVGPELYALQPVTGHQGSEICGDLLRRA
jgi:hypothetical protein